MNEQDCRTIIKNSFSKLRKSEQKAAQIALENPDVVLKSTLAEYAEYAKVSEASIIRFVRAAGFSGYSDFKLKFAQSLGTQSTPELLVETGLDEKTELSTLPEKIISKTISALEDTLRTINKESFEKAVSLLASCDRIALFGVGNSGSVAGDFACKLLRIGKNASYFSDAHLQHLSAVHLGENALAIGISHSGNTIDTVEALHRAKLSGASTLAISNYKAKSILKYADIALLTGSHETTFYSETTVSRISQLAIVDMLYMGLIMKDYEGSLKQLDKTNTYVQDKVY